MLQHRLPPPPSLPRPGPQHRKTQTVFLLPSVCLSVRVSVSLPVSLPVSFSVSSFPSLSTSLCLSLSLCISLCLSVSLFPTPASPILIPPSSPRPLLLRIVRLTTKTVVPSVQSPLLWWHLSPRCDCRKKF